MNIEPGTLYIVATPIGNLADMTYRAVEVLSQVEAIYAEDTRVSGVLLKHYQIEAPLFSYREAAERNQVEKTIRQIIFSLYEGKSLAYISDAGTPGVSDPGSYLVQKVLGAGFSVTPIPGVSALATLLSVSGLVVQRPLFVGFLPKKKGHQTLMKSLKEGLSSGSYDGLVFYESPERIIKLLQELLEWTMPIMVCLGRELTKIYEEFLRGSVEEVLAILQKRPSIKGEITLIVTLENKKES